jgi:hypothetical protein
MADRRGFAEWEGHPVMVFYTGGNIREDYGVLEEINEWGLVLRSYQRIVWGTPQEESGGQDMRQVSQFRLWRMISSVRVLEREEREARGL